MLLLRADPGIFMRAVAENKLHQVSTLPKMKVLTCVEACHGLRSKDSESFHSIVLLRRMVPVLIDLGRSCEQYVLRSYK